MLLGFGFLEWVSLNCTMPENIVRVLGWRPNHPAPSGTSDLALSVIVPCWQQPDNQCDPTSGANVHAPYLSKTHNPASQVLFQQKVRKHIKTHKTTQKAQPLPTKHQTRGKTKKTVPKATMVTSWTKNNFWFLFGGAGVQENRCREIGQVSYLSCSWRLRVRGP